MKKDVMAGGSMNPSKKNTDVQPLFSSKTSKDRTKSRRTPKSGYKKRASK